VFARLFRLRFAGFLLILSVLSPLVGCSCSTPPVELPGDEKRPKLAVIIVFDQMRGDYLKKWQQHFDKGGFGRLLEDGAWFQNCHYPYAATITSAGHASMATGCSPMNHGIVANNWYDRKLGATIESITSARTSYVPAHAKGTGGVSPEWLKRPTVGDALMDQTGGKGKVVSLSIKDRPSILMAALRALLCLWFNSETGLFETSTHYGTALPRWVTEFNQARVADQWFGKDWNRLRADLDYAKLSGPDDFTYEGHGYKQGRTFPHPTTGGLEKPGEEYYDAVANSPFGNELVLELAKRAIDAEGLGQDDIPDLLCLSFSSNDMVGHCWGPDSQEVLDITLRSDLVIKELLDYLDRKVGKGNYIVTVCADHGVCPLPELLQAKGEKAGRVSPQLLTTKAAEFLSQKYTGGKEQPWIEASVSEMVYFNQGTLGELKLKQADVEKALADWLSEQPGVQKAYTRTELGRGPIANDAIGEMVRKSFHPERSGDVLVVLEPYYLLWSPLTAGKTGAYTTTHGSPHPYDTHVPLLVYGANVKAGVRQERVTPQTVANIIAEGLKLEPLQTAEYAAPKGLWK
jgi:predicted AlkP superfamily pyrophosphatase or phosphodiesterase